MTERDDLIRQYEDLRYNLSLRAFTAPDASDEEMLESLDARIRDAVSANGTPPSGDVVQQAARTLHKRSHEPMATLDNWREYAQTLADAGLLRTPPQPDAPKICTACRDGESPCRDCAPYVLGRWEVR